MVVYNASLGGNCGPKYQFLLNNNGKDVNLRQKNSLNVQSLKDVVRHAAYSEPKFIREHVLGIFQKDLLENPNASLYLIQGMTYSANAESGLGKGHIYATTDFFGKCRHDFVEVSVNIDGTEGVQLAQCIAFLEFSIAGDAPQHFAVVQYLRRFDENVKRKKGEPIRRLFKSGVFKSYKWETMGQLWLRAV